LQLEERKKEKEALRNIEKWARGKRGSEEARAAVAGLTAPERQRYFARTLAKSRVPAARLLVAKELGKIKSKTSLASLANSAIADRQPAVRAECLTALKSQDDPTTAEQFVPYLRSASRVARIRAAQAVEVFPTRRAVPVLIEGIRRVWDDFGRGFIFQGTQRSFIKDYNLVSGGTGFSLIEVADPEIDTISTGTVLDVKVRRVEIISYVRALRKITGQEFGADPREWRAWWLKNKDER
jgi:hypothetical protein